jgi:ERCC4-related helicase
MSEQPPLSPGMRVLCRDAEWLVTRVDPADFANTHYAVHCLGVDDLSRGHESIFLTQLDEITPVDPRKTQLVQDTSSGFRLSKLFLEAQLRQMPATSIEPDLEGLGAFTPMQYQIDAVSLALKQLRPRLLLADSVGLGKTIQVGMILTELMRRGRANRILVLAKKSMLTQFQSELWNRFALPLVRLDSAGIAKLRLRIPANKNPFEVYHRVIISIDTLKNVGSYQHFLEKTRWDVVVIDEAHNVAGASVPERHLAYRLARTLSRKTDSMLLTTATPHNGKRETFGRLISLLDPSTIPDPLFREYTADDIKGFFLMRFKEDVRNEAGENLSERQVVPLTSTTVDATPAEEAVYGILAELRKAVTTKTDSDNLPATWKNQGLIQYGLYKLFLSSPEACRSTVQGRLQRESADHPDSPELPYLKRLLGALAKLDLKNSARFQLLKQQLKAIGWDGTRNSPRVLIFTEYRHTQDALATALAAHFKLVHSEKFEDQPNQVLATIHGSCPDVHLMKTIEAFGTGSAPVRLLLATDVASEGINLHHECHNIIHYDLPWSIITLIQRNGRIDRFGQHISPVLRYLIVNTQQGLLTGDNQIFQRLVDKVEEINHSTRQGESVLKLYDPEAEARYIAEEGILSGNVNVLERVATAATSEAAALEALLHAASPDDDDLLDFLLSDSDTALHEKPAGSKSGSTKSAIAKVTPTKVAETKAASRLRLYADKSFLLEAYRFLTEQQGDSNYLPIEEHGKVLTLTAPPDLKRRLGAPDARGDVIFGSTAIPVEAWPEHGQFKLTPDPKQVEQAILAARNMSGYWSGELLCTERHPILLWLTERLLMQMKRGEAPIISSKHLDHGELCFCFIGQVSSQAGTPLIVDAHAISFRKGGRFQHRPLSEALTAARFDQLTNTGHVPNLLAAQALIPSAVDASREHMRTLRTDRDAQLMPILRKEERRLRNWCNKRRELLEQRIEELSPNHPKSRQYRKQIEEMDDYVKDRQQNWQQTHMMAAAEPSTQLILVIEGSN